MLATTLSVPAFSKDADKSPKKPEPAKAQPEQSPEVKSVQPEVEKEKKEKATEKRKELVKEAVDTIAQVEKALKALEENKKDEALEILATVAGKLDILVARDPTAGFLPVSVEEIVVDVVADLDAIKKVIDKAKKALDDGNVQEARHLLKNLGSELVIRTAYLPLASFPDDIKAVAPLIDAGKVEEAKDALRAALNSLVLRDEIIPLPPLRASAMLDKTEKLAEKKNRTDEEDKRLRKLLEAARKQLELSQLLGYGKQPSYASIYKELDTIEKKVEGKRSGQGWFDTLKEKMSKLLEWL